MLAQQVVRTYYVVDWNAVGAIATSVAVIVALGWEPLRKWWNKPVLRVIWRERDSETADIDESLGGEITYVRLLVTNTGRTAAQRIELTVADVYRRNADGSRDLVRGFLPTALIWTHSDSPRWKNLAPKTSRLCNLGAFYDQREMTIPDPPKTLYFDLDTEIRPASGYNRLREGAYIARIVATAINCRKADILEIGINVGPHAVDGEEMVFSIFDEEQLQKTILRRH